MAILLKLLHVMAAIWFIAGLLGRNLAIAQARKTGEVRMVAQLMQLAGRFDNLLVIPGSWTVLILGLLTAWDEGYPILGQLQGGQANWALVSLILFLTIVPLVPLVFIPRGKAFGNTLEEALAENQMTPQLTSALSDRIVSAAHRYELVVIAVIIVLMVTKPF